MAKRIKWMMTIWGEEFPEFLKELPELNIGHMQLEVTTAQNKLHWQTFVQFKKPVTKSAVFEFIRTKHGRDVHVGRKKHEDDDTDENWTAHRGINYVWGYGPLALSKLCKSQQRYIIRPNEIIHTPVDEDHMKSWYGLSSTTRAYYSLAKTRSAIRQLIWDKPHKFDDPFLIRKLENPE